MCINNLLLLVQARLIKDPRRMRELSQRYDEIPRRL